MRKSITDRNLLLALLAMQLGFITQNALLTAIRTWVRNKQKSMSTILQEQNTLDNETLKLLEALVAKYLALHGNDPEKSLAALSSIDISVREELERLSDSDVQASLQHASTAATIDAPPATTGAVGASTSKGLRFRVLRPHAKGGLGLVYVAHDEELNRDVALKEIQDRHADRPESRTRFMLEAEITGGLEHPGIVPVYGLGQYADGRPFYAMRFIRGDSLKDAITKFHADGRSWREKSLMLRELLERLIDVCNAMQYAHDRGVLHRDLKPGNIMLGRYGETLVVDWGLAKPLGAIHEATAGATLSEEPMLRPASGTGSAATIEGSAVGTPQYMSPEQAAGRLDQMGPASDVYSLGATLYSILTGRAPFEATEKMDLAALLDRVKRGDFPPPRQHNSEISRPLNAICLKAMALEPSSRYVHPRELIDDLKHWLADEPVNAWPEPWTVKTRRWMARHRTLVTGVAAALFVGVVSLSIATLLLKQANDVIQKSNDDLTSANDAIKKESEAKEAQRALAEARLTQSLDAVGLFANDARKYCEDAMVPGESRRRLYEVLITQLERQVSGDSGEATIDQLRNKVWMYQTLCAVNIDFNELRKAKQAFDQGMKNVERWDKIRPGDASAQTFRAALLHLHGTLLEQDGKLADAKVAYNQALDIRGKLVADVDVGEATKAVRIAALADSLERLEQFEEALKLREEVAKANAKDKDAHFAARESWCWTLQKAALEAKAYAKRKAYLIQADQMSDELIRERKSSRSILSRWALIAKSFGELEYNFGKLAEKDGKADESKKHYREADKHYRKLNEISRKLATSNELIEGVRDYSRSFYTLGLVEQLNGYPEKARDKFEKSRAIRELAFHDYSNNPMSAHLQIDLLFSQIALNELRAPLDVAENMVWVFQSEPDAEYRLACIFALAIQAVAEARKPNPLTDQDKRLQNRYRTEAIRCLQIAHDGGFSDFFHTSIDADLESLRDDPRMKEFEASHAYNQGVSFRKRGDLPVARLQFQKAQILAAEWLKSERKDTRQALVESIALCARVQLGNHAEAMERADAILRTLDRKSAASFRLASVYSLASAATINAKQQDEYRTKAINLLQESKDGLTQQRLMSNDDFEPIRDDPRFLELLKAAKKKR